MKTFYEQLHYAAQDLTGQRIPNFPKFVFESDVFWSDKDTLTNLQRVAVFLSDNHFAHNAIARAICHDKLWLDAIINELAEKQGTNLFREGMRNAAELLPALKKWYLPMGGTLVGGVAYGIIALAGGDAVTSISAALYGTWTGYKSDKEKMKEKRKFEVAEQIQTIDRIVHRILH